MDGQPTGSEYLGPLLRTLAESLDVQEVFARISAEARRLVPHEFLFLGLLSQDRQRARVIVLSGDLPGIPREMAFPEVLRPVLDQDVFVVNDVQLQPGGQWVSGRLRLGGGETGRTIVVEAHPLLRQLVAGRGLHSFLRATVRLKGGVVGGLIFCSTAADAYQPADALRARQIADCVALAVAHQRLAEAERESAEARDRASRLEDRVRRLTEEAEAQGQHRVLGHSPRWREAIDQATKVAPTEATVLLAGESGTGKEVLARFIHRASPRAEGPFVALNCAALPEHLLESDLFGHEKGAFTGALAARPGRIEQATGGVLFLGEVAEMSLPVQAKLLRVLQEREYQRLGGVKTLQADIRVLAATNRDLRAAIARGAFREDLYYRLAVFDITLPPLRERAEDIITLAEAFLADIGRSVGRLAAGVSEKARQKLLAYAWPGNVRELRNAMERAVILCQGGLVTSEHLPMGVVASSGPGPAPAAGAPAPASPGAGPPAAEVAGAAPGPATLEAAEREMIRQALAQAGQNKSKAARLLGLTRGQLRSRLEKHRLEAGPEP